MGRATRPLLALGAFLVLMFAQSSSPQARLQNPCDSWDTRGISSDTLCPGDYLRTSTYLASANNQFRLYVGNCDVIEYDVSDFDNFQVVGFLYYPDQGCAAHFTYGDDFEGADSAMNYSVRDSDGGLVTYFDVEFQPEGGHFLRLDNDGCVRIYDQEGARVRVNFGNVPACF